MHSDEVESKTTWQDETRYVSARKAAQMLGTSYRTVRKLAVQGQLETEASASTLEVSLASVERLRSERR